MNIHDNILYFLTNGFIFNQKILKRWCDLLSEYVKVILWQFNYKKTFPGRLDTSSWTTLTIYWNFGVIPRGETQP